MIVTALALALVAAAPSPVAASAQLQSPTEAGALATRPLAAGRTREAIAVLERASAADPGDAAVLINLGIAYAHAGEEQKARAAFAQALACPEVVELQTADGTTTDSRRLARRALKMLERGELRPAAAPAGQLTYRDQ
jgi:tetratricopeptide (TPR) repeat protein